MPTGVYERRERSIEHRGNLSGAMLGKKPSREARLKMRLAKLGKKRGPHSEQTKQKIRVALMGNKNPLGHKHTQAAKDKVSRAMRGNKRMLGKKQSTYFMWRMSGANSPNWKGGATPVNTKIRMSSKYKEWRKRVFERDNWTCQECGARAKAGLPVIIHADHIKPFAYFPALHFEVSNGRTLCKPCHLKTDTYSHRAKHLYADQKPFNRKNEKEKR